MPHEGRTSGNCPERNNEELERSGVGCAAGQAHVCTPKYKPIPSDHRACLARLVEAGRMIRRHDGSYGTPSAMMIPNHIATALKARRMIVAGFNSEVVPTELGRRFNAESDDATL